LENNMTPQFTLDKIELLAMKYGTDKFEHGYLAYYHNYLNGYDFKLNRMLEIGCHKGASLHMWNELFHGQIKIHTADIFSPGSADQDTLRKLGYVTHQGDQSDIRFLYTINQMFDFIIDDGSHNSDHQIITFKHLFLNNLCSGGIYVIEDLHCCREEFYWNGIIERIEDTMLGILTKYTGPTKMFNESECNLFFNKETGLIERFVVYNEKIAFLVRR